MKWRIVWLVALNALCCSVLTLSLQSVFQIHWKYKFKYEYITNTELIAKVFQYLKFTAKTNKSTNIITNTTNPKKSLRKSCCGKRWSDADLVYKNTKTKTNTNTKYKDKYTQRQVQIQKKSLRKSCCGKRWSDADPVYTKTKTKENKDKCNFKKIL